MFADHIFDASSPFLLRRSGAFLLSGELNR